MQYEPCYFYLNLKDVHQSMQYWTMLALLLIVFLLERCTSINAVLNHVSIATYCISTWKMYSKMHTEPCCYLLYFYLKDVQQNAVLNHVSIAYCISTWKMYINQCSTCSIATYCISTWKMYSKMQYWTMLALLLIVFLLERCTAKCSTEPC